MDLSYIIVNWNTKEFLSKCLQSLASQAAGHDSEIIVVDNASSDGSQVFVQNQFPQVKLIQNKENLGFAKANNIGIKNSSGKFLVFINSDIKVLNGCVDSMLAYMNEYLEIGMLGPQILDSHGNIQRSCMGFPTLWNTFCRAMSLDSLFPKSKLFGAYLMTFWPHNTTRAVDVLNGCFWMVKRAALDQVGLLDERYFIYAEDKDWCKEFWNSEWKVVFFHQAQAIHYGGASSSNAPIRFYIEMQRANLQYWKKHHSRPAQFVFLLLVGLQHIIRLFGGTVLYILKPSKKASAAFKIKRSMACIRWLLSFNYERPICHDT